MSENPKVQMVCSHCGSDDVMRDAWAEWDVEKQDWVLSSVYDHTYCEGCEGETTLSEALVVEVFEVTAHGFVGDGSKDELVIWVAANSADDLVEVIAGTGARYCGTVATEPDNDAVDFTLPAQREELRARLKQFFDSPMEGVR